jgi:hypothetical protein
MSALLPGPAVAGMDGTIIWEQKEIMIKPGPHETRGRGRFTFTNTGDEPLNITSIQTTCGCTAAEAGGADKKGLYAPGTRGHIDVTMSFSRGAGIVRKALYVNFRSGSETLRQKLIIAVEAFRYVELEQQFLSWTCSKKEPEPQKVLMSVPHTSPIHLVEVKTQGNDDFDVQWDTLNKGRRYEIRVKPANLDEQKTTKITLVTDFPSTENPLTYEIRAVVRPLMPVPAETQSLLIQVLRTSEGVMALVGTGLAVVAGAVTIMLVLRTPKTMPQEE